MTKTENVYSDVNTATGEINVNTVAPRTAQLVNVKEAMGCVQKDVIKLTILTITHVSVRQTVNVIEIIIAPCA